MIRTAFMRAGEWGTAALVSLVPLSAAAATFKDIVNGPIVRIGDTFVYLLYGIAFMVFAFGMLKYFFTSGAEAEENRRKGRQFMLWGIIVLFVLFAVWGIVQLLLGVLQSWA